MAASSSDSRCVYRQIHIDVARNATDDFNPFHDGDKWTRIRGNPFGGPIVLGFQLECLAEALVTRMRIAEGDAGSTSQLRFRNYQFTFAGALRVDEPFTTVVKPTLRGTDASGQPQVSNRIAMRKGSGLVLLGHVRDSLTPQALPGESLPLPADVRLEQLEDRCVLADNGWFHKRKFMSNSNAKNLLSGSLVRQADYFDELEDRINFPDMFPAALISCALLEKADADGHDFYRDPMVYTAHHISVDQRLARALRSADALHILVSPAEQVETAGRGLAGSGMAQLRYRCMGLVAGPRILFRGELFLAPLMALSEAMVSGPAAP
ncbi:MULTISPECIES: hypothetical protein [Thioalkalivibrio]|uniref:MaoC-like domain-containing protein n=1 Tax=Thioalkalivibrio versutus TaxID=106634 RepID=A0A0G3FY76_9GAMM|nr:MULTISPECIES: hypothetical protein [Thioalkalivibrio]AKJ93940.1 hypothetical protein TVD_00535 [Thioalkalivibrio versutus]